VKVKKKTIEKKWTKTSKSRGKRDQMENFTNFKKKKKNGAVENKKEQKAKKKS